MEEHDISVFHGENNEGSEMKGTGERQEVVISASFAF
jgi:hypothetical protein